jgi:single-stranded-DNA-specific exonuclease
MIDSVDSSLVDNKSRSVRGLDWEVYEQDESTVANFMTRLNVSELVARMIYNRNIRSISDAKVLLQPMIRDLIPNPRKMLDMDKATSRVLRALNDEEKITIFADYDVDGATSGALLYKFFDSIGEKVEVYVPNRFSEGYGPNNSAFDKIKYGGTSLVIIVDCGSVAFEPLAYAKKIGLDIIVIDHHVTDIVLPQTVALLNPNRYDETFEPKTIAAVAVTFLFLVALRSELRNNSWFNDKLPEPNLMDFLDVVALGTVCDLMPLIPLNRAFIKQGLKLIQNGSNYGITALLEACKIRCNVQTHHLGYTIGPRINAGGRLDDSSLGFRLLTAKSNEDAIALAESLEFLNNERKSLEALTLSDAMKNIIKEKTSNVIISIGEGWHQGVLGIIASRLKEDYHKPTFVMTIDENTRVAKGSVRSIIGVDAAVIIQEAKDNGILIEGGGHPMAGGFSLCETMINQFADFIEKRVIEMLSEGKNLLGEAKKIMVDGIISIDSIRPEFFNEILKLEPFGMGNPKPYFIIDNVIIKHVNQNKGICFVTIADFFNHNIVLKCLCFTSSSKSIVEFLRNHQSKKIKVLGNLQANNLYDGQVNFVIEDIAIYD